MNRKETQEQNDISIIIGNLPKRLQEKITREGRNSKSGGSSNDCKSNVNDGSGGKKYEGNGVHVAKVAEVNTSNILPSMPHESVTNGNEATSIDFFLRLSVKTEHEEEKVEKVKPVLESSGSLTNPTSREKQNENQANNVVPGLIRLNAEDAKILSESQDSKNGLRNHDRRNRYQTRQELLSARYELPMSPVRHLQQLNHPMWFEALNDENANRLPPLFEGLQNAMSHNVVIKVMLFMFCLRSFI